SVQARTDRRPWISAQDRHLWQGIARDARALHATEAGGAPCKHLGEGRVRDRMRRRIGWPAYCAAVGALLLPRLLGAQSLTTGELGGWVVGSAGEPVDGALVTLSNGPGSASRSTRSDAEGRFAFDFLVAGDYQLIAEALGWRPAL